VGRKSRLWRYLKNNQGCQIQCREVHKAHTNDANTTYIDIVALYRDQLNDEGYKASQKAAYANRKQQPEECPLAYASLVEYLEEEAMPHVFDQHGNKVHCQPIETFVTRVTWGLDKNWMKQRLITAMSQQKIKTRKDVTRCLTDAVNELRMSRENNIDPSCAYPNTMSHLNADRYAMAAPDAPGLYEPSQEPGIAAIFEDVIRRMVTTTTNGATLDPTTRICYGCGKPGHLKNACRALPKMCAHCQKPGHDVTRCWIKDPSQRPPRFKAVAPRPSPGGVREMTETTPPLEWRPEAPVFPWGQSM
jgi:hypothetical protein